MKDTDTQNIDEHQKINELSDKELEAIEEESCLQRINRIEAENTLRTKCMLADSEVSLTEKKERMQHNKMECARRNIEVLLKCTNQIACEKQQNAKCGTTVSELNDKIKKALENNLAILTNTDSLK